MFTNIGLPDIERRKRKRNLLLGQPQGSLSERIDTPCAYVDLQLFILMLLIILTISSLLVVSINKIFCQIFTIIIYFDILVKSNY